jgi:CDP-4-dehydro-6-deoxyglucose reductase
MKNVVTLSPSNTAFSVEANETILAAAKQQGLNLPHSCQNGICGQCKAEVLSGEVIQGEHTEQALSASERSAGKNSNVLQHYAQ